MIGEGKYDQVCSLARMAAGAEGALLIVLNGRHGNGFSAQISIRMVEFIPALLRDVANQIEAEAMREKIRTDRPPEGDRP